MSTQELVPIFEDAFPFWEGLNNYDKDTFLHSSVEINYHRGATIHDGGECTGVIIVESGVLRLYMLSDEGKEVTLYRLFPGEVCILSASCVLETLTFDVLIDAEEDSKCIVVGGCAYEGVWQRSDAVKIYTYETALSRFSDVVWVMQQILFMSMDKRLAIFLLDEISKTGGDAIKLTHEQIAKYMGSAREVVSRTMKYFSNEGIVEASRKGVRILDKKKLRELAL
jgi:CRP/FNR family transcriptional regulator